MNPDTDHQRDVPVPWAKLKEINDAHAPPRFRLEQLVGILMGLVLIGISAVTFFIAVVTFLDTHETVEPSASFVIQLIGLGVLGLVGGMILVLSTLPTGRSQP